MKLFESAIWFMAGVAALVTVALIAAFWWAGLTPNRPKTVQVNSVFLWAPHVGLPGPKRGAWLFCWYSEGKDFCRLSDAHGSTKFEGEFLPYKGKSALPSDQLRIDADKSSDRKVWVGSELIPLVYLQSGDILIPASNYKDGLQLLAR
jgi:hypothetical protein